MSDQPFSEDFNSYSTNSDYLFIEVEAWLGLQKKQKNNSVNCSFIYFCLFFFNRKSKQMTFILYLRWEGFLKIPDNLTFHSQ